METSKNTNQSENNQNKSTFVEPKVYLSKDRNYITMVLPGNVLVRKPCNYFKAIMGLKYDRLIK